MTDPDLIPPQLLKRKAVVYVHLSTQSQVMTNLECQRRQYDLVDIARQNGLSDIEEVGLSIYGCELAQCIVIEHRLTKPRCIGCVIGFGLKGCLVDDEDRVSESEENCVLVHGIIEPRGIDSI